MYNKKLINIIITLALMAHTFIAHDILQNYVVCYGADGHIEIENINESESCQTNENIELSANLEQLIFSTSGCNDISFDENCYERGQYLVKENIIIAKCNLEVGYVLYSNMEPQKRINKFQNISICNSILKEYTTVSLLI